MNTFNQLENIRKTFGTAAIALIDPDIKNDLILESILDKINKSHFDAIFIGGSHISDNYFDKRLKFIKNNTDLPLIIFPGSSNQVSEYADAILFLSLISGRNPQYLIGEHVKSAPIIHNLNLEVIPTGYILLDGGNKSSVEIISNTSPIPMNKYDIILAHALAGEYLGNKFLFFESGSGANNHASIDLIKFISKEINIPIIIGGGINNADSAKQIADSGASYVVTGTLIEKDSSISDLIKITNAIHHI